MSESESRFIEEIRKFLPDFTSSDFSIPVLAGKMGIPASELTGIYKNEAGLIEAVLRYEQQTLEQVFSDVDFDGINAIESLLQVSKEINQKSDRILPSITFDLRHRFPEIHQKIVDMRVKFVDELIKSNFQQGIQQGIYRPDLSTELISRIYTSRLIDLQNPDFFPSESFSFQVVFDVMFDTFIRGICTEEGRAYYDDKKRFVKF
jgi:TetR/AcrR family transcriptional regulator, cholesterol catabolism regulator